jgi:hypothetical protein
MRYALVVLVVAATTIVSSASAERERSQANLKTVAAKANFWRKHPCGPTGRTLRLNCHVGVRKLNHYTNLERRLRRQQWLVLPQVSDWLVAVKVAQRVFPGTEQWLRSCSASEGGWGGFVMNRQGSGAGGNLQFMESTFWRMYGAARDEARRKGFDVPASTSSWSSPLGQALAGAWGVSNGRRGEWSGHGCG